MCGLYLLDCTLVESSSLESSQRCSTVWIYEKAHAKNDRLLERDKLLIPTPQIEFELNPKSKKLYEDTWLKSDFFELKQNRITMHIPPWPSWHTTYLGTGHQSPTSGDAGTWARTCLGRQRHYEQFAFPPAQQTQHQIYRQTPRLVRYQKLGFSFIR